MWRVRLARGFICPPPDEPAESHQLPKLVKLVKLKKIKNYGKKQIYLELLYQKGPFR